MPVALPPLVDFAHERAVRHADYRRLYFLRRTRRGVIVDDQDLIDNAGRREIDNRGTD